MLSCQSLLGSGPAPLCSATALRPLAGWILIIPRHSVLQPITILGQSYPFSLERVPPLLSLIHNRLTVSISFLLPKLHKTARASSENKSPGKLEAEMINGLSPPTAIFAGVKRFPPPRGLVPVQPLC